MEDVARRNRLDTGRDSELVQRFVRMNLEQNEEIAPLPEGAPEPGDSTADQQAQGGDASVSGPTQPQDSTQQSQGDEQGKTEGGDASEGEGESRSRRVSTVSLGSQRRLLAKQIHQELGKKRRRRRMRSRKHEEMYTDKDRAAAMSMGSKDIKTSLKAKRRQDRSRALSIPEEAEPGNFIALGAHEQRAGRLHLAVGFYTKALELNPVERGALVARSQCHLVAGRPDLALKDAEAALGVDATCTRAIYQKAEALYYLGEFEHSLVYYHRGLRARPDLEGFRLGVHKAQRAIENAIGAAVRSRPPTQQSGEGQRAAQEEAGATAPHSRLLHVPRQLCAEMRYLGRLLKHPDIECRLDGRADLTPKVQEAVDYLTTRHEFWRQQLPPKFR